MIDKDKIREKNKIVEKALNNSRIKWNTNVSKLIKSFGVNHFEEIPELQVTLLAYRVRLLDYLNELHVLKVKSKTFFEDKRLTIFTEIKTKFNIKLNGSETEKMVNSELRVVKERIELTEYQIYYIEGLIKTLDNLAFAIKNHIEIHKFQAGD